VNRFAMTPETIHGRRPGITLLEVLISLGVLTIGLVSVVSLLPAGRSLAVKAAVYDRASALASNAAADLINRGLLRSEKWLKYSEDPSTPTSQFLVFDPLGPSWFGKDDPQNSLGCLRPDAAGAAQSLTAFLPNASGLPVNPVPPAATDIVFRAEDEPIYSTEDVGNDDPPLPKWSPSNTAPARRAFQGNYSYLATLKSSNTIAPYWSPANTATLTVVVFHRRGEGNPTPSIADATANANGWPVPLSPGQSVKDLVRPGNMVLWCNNQIAPTACRWYRVLMATEADGRAFITCEGSDPPAAAGNVLYLFPASVAALEMPVRLEGTSEWNR
jgi:type II secretory pathway pseudopilin PulG